MRAAILSTLAVTASLASAHFQVLYPPQGIPFNDEEEATGPCGGPDPEVSDSSAEVQVDQFAVSVRSTHPEGNWAFRATTSTTAPYNFTDITPMIMSTGIGEFCLTSLSVPSEYAGSAGIIQIVDDSEHGALYQCIPVNFVEGANSTVGPACTNSSGFSAEYASGDSSDSGHSDGGHSHGTMSMSGSMSMPMSSGASATADGAAASSTSSPDGAAMVTGVGALAGLGMVVAGLAL